MKELEVVIRKAVFDGHSAEIRALLLNNEQVELIALIKEGETMRANILSSLKDISIQNASAKLNRLYTAGYLKRLETGADSGGIEYFYYVPEP